MGNSYLLSSASQLPPSALGRIWLYRHIALPSYSSHPTQQGKKSHKIQNQLLSALQALQRPLGPNPGQIMGRDGGPETMKAKEIPLLEISNIRPVAKPCLSVETPPGFCLWNRILLSYIQVFKQIEAA